jgi:hypothetical protein
MEISVVTRCLQDNSKPFIVSKYMSLYFPLSSRHKLAIKQDALHLLRAHVPWEEAIIFIITWDGIPKGSQLRTEKPCGTADAK